MFKSIFSMFVGPFMLTTLLVVGGCDSSPPDKSGNHSAPQAPEDHDGKDHADSDVEGLHDVPLTDEEIAQLKDDTATYEDAVAHIRKFEEEIHRETTGGTPAKAHRALDNLDVVLERLPEAASNSDIPKARWQEINETGQELRELFNQVHAKIDAGEDPDYAAVAARIDAAIGRLAAIGERTRE